MTDPLLLQNPTHWMGGLIVVLWAIKDLPRPEAYGALADFSLPQRRRAAFVLCAVAAATVYLMLLSAFLAIGPRLGFPGSGRLAFVAVLCCILALRLLPGPSWAWDRMRVALHHLVGFPDNAQEMARLLRQRRAKRVEADAVAASLDMALDPHGAGFEELREAMPGETLALVLEAHRLHLRLSVLVPRAADAASHWHDLMRGRPGVAGRAGDGAGHAVGGAEAGKSALWARIVRLAPTLLGVSESEHVPPGLVSWRLTAWQRRQAAELARLSLYHGRLVRRAAEAAIFVRDLREQLVPPGSPHDERLHRRLYQRISTLIAEEAETLIADGRRLLAGAALSLSRGADGREAFLLWAGYSGHRVGDLPVWPIAAVMLIDVIIIGVGLIVLPAPPGMSHASSIAILLPRLPFMFVHASGMALAAGLAVWPKLHFNAARPAFEALPWRSYLAIGGLAWMGGVVITTLLFQATPKPPGAHLIDLILGSSMFFAAISVSVAWRIDRRLIDRAAGRYVSLRDGLLVGGSYLLVDLLFRLAIQRQIGFLVGPNSAPGVKLPPAIAIWPLFFCFAAAVGMLIPNYAASYIANAGIRERRVPYRSTPPGSSEARA